MMKKSSLSVKLTIGQFMLIQRESLYANFVEFTIEFARITLNFLKSTEIYLNRIEFS